MNVLVVGAGTVGTIHGWALAESGHHVVHLVRSGRAAALSNGLAIDLFDKRKGRKRSFRGLYKLTAVEALTTANSFELIIVPTKHYALAQTLGEIAPQAVTADFLLLTQSHSPHATSALEVSGLHECCPQTAGNRILWSATIPLFD